MAETVLTIEIAKQIQAALVAAINDASIKVMAAGVSDFSKEKGDEAAFPCVMVGVAECQTMQYESRQLEFPVSVTVATFLGDDPDQTTLFTVAQAVRQWLANPSLTLTLATFDSLTIDAPPDIDQVFDVIQRQQWLLTARVLRPAS